MDAANLLKPMLARGKLKVIGATTLNEYREYIEKDSAFERRFAQVIVDEPSVPDTVASEWLLLLVIYNIWLTIILSYAWYSRKI